MSKLNRCSRCWRLATAAIVALATVAIAGCGGVEESLVGGPGSDPAKTVAHCESTGFISIEIVDGDSRSARVGTTVGGLAVRLRCLGGDPYNVRDATIEWTVLTGGGTIGGAHTTTSTTDLSGYTSASWTLGPIEGQQSVEARFTSPYEGYVLTRTFTASATAPTGCEATGGTDHGTYINLAANTVWSAAASPHRGGFVILQAGVTLTVEPGAVICVERIEATSTTGGLIAEGTAQEPIQFIGTSLQAASSLKFVEATDALCVGQAIAGRLVSLIEDSSFKWRSTTPRNPLDCAQVAVGGTSAAVRRTVISDYGSQDCAALHAAAFLGETVTVEARITGSSSDAVLVGGSGTVRLANCSLTNNGRHGVFVFAPGSPPSNPTAISVNACNLQNNAGDGVFSPTATNPVDATGNWWGDASGALGGGSDGVTGMVDVGAHLTSPRVLGY